MSELASTFFTDCAPVSELFYNSRMFWNERFIKKMAINSVYYDRVDTQTWPMNTLPEQQGFRFNRGWYDPTTPWDQVTSTTCGGNGCEANFELIADPGTNVYTWQLFKKQMRTEWYCLTNFIHKLFPEQQLEHIWDTNAGITKNVHEEFTRTNYIGLAGHKWAGVATEDSLVSCTLPDDQMFFLKQYEGDLQGSYDSRYIYVKLPASDLANISLLNLDELDDALINLQREDDAYRLDISEAAGRPLLEIITPDTRTVRNLWQYAKQSGGWWEANTDFSDPMQQYALGIDRVIGNYAFCNDINGWRGEVDWAYNAGLDTFDEADITTYPRLKRILPYIAVPANALGCNYIQNPAFNNADFAITVAWVMKAVTKWIEPTLTGIGQAQVAATQNFAGEWIWKNPDWECNVFRNQGFFYNQFRLAMQPVDPTLSHVFLHRLNTSRIMPGACCDLQTGSYYQPPAADCFACPGVGVGDI